MTEKDWQSRVVDLAKLMGWRIYSARAAQTAKGWRTPVTSKGFPDLLLLKAGRMIAAELKVGTAVRSEQAEWLNELGQVAGVETYVWRPDDWDAVVDVLRAKREARSSEPRASMAVAG